jgi:hypothetical protein
MRKAIAIDFDGYLCTNAYPEIGEPNWPVIRRAQAEQRAGAGLILRTCREDQLLLGAIAVCEGWGLTFDAVNESLPDWIEEFKTRPRKVGASEYWDDKAVQLPVVPIDPLPPMKRLTSREPRISGNHGVSCAHFRGKDCETVQGCCSDGCPWEEAVWERLAAYEDTGLTPEEVQIIAEMLAGDPYVPILQASNLVKAYREGRAEILPPNDPLSLEQMREMDGEPVWIESKTAQYGNYWLIQVDGGIVSFRNRAGYGFRFEEVTDGWSSKIYRRKPEEGTS